MTTKNKLHRNSTQIEWSESTPTEIMPSRKKTLIKLVIVAVILVAIWQAIVSIFSIPHYILASPLAVFHALIDRFDVLIHHASITLIEILLGLLLGFLLGLSSAILLASSQKVSALMLPILLISQAIPVFAIAPLLVLWLGFGMASKIAMTVLILYFPVTLACYDGLRNTPQEWLDIATTMNAKPTARLFKIKLPAALPALASGLRIATSFAPIGAIVGEWVGSAEGLGYLMLQANARMQVDTVFAALFVLILLSLTLYFSVDTLLKKWIPWQKYS